MPLLSLERVTLHDCRHSYASLAIASGVNGKALRIYMGHASITETLDRYGHSVRTRAAPSVARTVA